METKQAIRTEIFRRRAAAGEAAVREASGRICERLAQTAQWRRASWIYAYMDFRREVMTGELLRRAWSEGKRVAVPRVEGDDLIFCEITDPAQCGPGYFGIPEPLASCPKADPAGAETLVIVPGVAFDRARHRVGYGKGFYDRYLSAHPEYDTAAVAFSWQMVERVPGEPQDVVPHSLVTEEAVYESPTLFGDARAL